jgi:UTP--glucose-1-phosphate uridylyltransferase
MKRTIRKAVIPVAGFGTRFLPATKSMPKEMLPIVDKPAIQYIVEEAVAAGLDEIIFVTGRNKRAIEDHFDTSYELECLLRDKGKNDLLKEMREISELARIVYVRQKEALGLGHAILQAKKVVGNEPFAILLGDDIIDSEEPVIGQMMKVYDAFQTSLVGVAEIPQQDTKRYGVIKPVAVTAQPKTALAKDYLERTHAVDEIVEKPEPQVAPSNLAVSGRYILNPEVFDFLEKTEPTKGGEIQITDAIANLMKKQGLQAYTYKGHWYDGGNKLEFIKAQVDFALKRPEFKEPLRQFLKDRLTP